MAESEEKLKSLFIRVKEEGEKAGLKLSIKNLRSGLQTGIKLLLLAFLVLQLADGRSWAFSAFII